VGLIGTLDLDEGFINSIGIIEDDKNCSRSSIISDKE
jgi:hypothetical protein